MKNLPELRGLVILNKESAKKSSYNQDVKLSKPPTIYMLTNGRNQSNNYIKKKFY